MLSNRLLQCRIINQGIISRLILHNPWIHHVHWQIRPIKGPKSGGDVPCALKLTPDPMEGILDYHNWPPSIDESVLLHGNIGRSTKSSRTTNVVHLETQVPLVKIGLGESPRMELAEFWRTVLFFSMWSVKQQEVKTLPSTYYLQLMWYNMATVVEMTVLIWSHSREAGLSITHYRPRIEPMSLAP